MAASAAATVAVRGRAHSAAASAARYRWFGRRAYWRLRRSLISVAWAGRPSGGELCCRPCRRRPRFRSGVAGQHFAQAHGHVGHVRHFARGRRFGPGFYDNDYGWCGYERSLLHKRLAIQAIPLGYGRVRQQRGQSIPQAYRPRVYFPRGRWLLKCDRLPPRSGEIKRFLSGPA